MEEIRVMVNGLPGKMAEEVAKVVTQSQDLELLSVGLGLEDDNFKYPFHSKQDSNYKPDIKIIGKDRHEDFLDANKDVEFISVDYAALKANPNTPNENANFYCKHGLPFVMGATGGDREALERRVKDSDTVAVIAPNMAPEIVGAQACIEDFSKEYEGSLKGCGLKIIESHQNGKADTSGTAKAMVEYFNRLGIPYTINQIREGMIRKPEEQLNLGIPENALKGHGWHTYKINLNEGHSDSLHLFASRLNSFLKHNLFKEYLISELAYFLDEPVPIIIPDSTRVSPDGTVRFSLVYLKGKYVKFAHNVNGRSIYANGTLDAIKFLNEKIKAGEKGKVYSMIDVLKRN